MTSDISPRATTGESATDQTSAAFRTDGGIAADPGDGGELVVDAPKTSRRDESVRIRIGGAPPGATVELRASVTDPNGATWRSDATYVADADGVVDLTANGPVNGSYEGVTPMGWLWSMRSDEGAALTALRHAERTVVEFEVKAGDRRAARSVERRLADSSVDRRRIADDGVVGTLYEPAASGLHSGVLVLHGSGGNPPEDFAALLATRGYAALALRYFGDEPAIPDALTRVPLSYFDRAAAWLRDRPGVRDGPLGAVGHSRGGELALLLGSRFDWVGAVVSYVGSGVAYNTPQGPAAWSEGGDPVPHVRATNEHARPSDDGTAPMLERALETTADEALRKATIPVEATDGPVLLVSGGDDPVWPARRLSEITVERLAAREFPYAVEHLTYDDAGHYIPPPYLPKTAAPFGGTPGGMARADADAWPRALDCLERGIGDGTDGPLETDGPSSPNQ